MKTVKLFVPILACMSGAFLAIAMQPAASKDPTIYNWVDKNNVLILIGTIAQAEANCPGTGAFCLRASDSTSLVVEMAL